LAPDCRYGTDGAETPGRSVERCAALARCPGAGRQSCGSRLAVGHGAAPAALASARWASSRRIALVLERLFGLRYDAR
jgi:hypothetical protein